MKKFTIPSIPSTTNKCIKFPDPIIKEVEILIKDKSCTFSAFVIEAVKFALEQVREDMPDN